MNQVEYNARYEAYRTQQREIAKKYKALKDQVEAGSDEEAALEEKEEAEIATAKKSFCVDTAGKIS
jgi:uncharacterized protein involved in exopolysaccharide biosynthesis